MTTKHTPGPWHAYHRYVATEDGVAIHNWPPTSMAVSTKQANARLIAAAPDLFKALQAALDDHNGIDTNINWQEAAHAAIAKAVGQ